MPGAERIAGALFQCLAAQQRSSPSSSPVLQQPTSSLFLHLLATCSSGRPWCTPKVMPPNHYDGAAWLPQPDNGPGAGTLLITDSSCGVCGSAVSVCAATVQDFLERYEVGETVGVGGEHCIASMQAAVAHASPAHSSCVLCC